MRSHKYMMEEGTDLHSKFYSFTQFLDIIQDEQSETTYLLSNNLDDPESNITYITLSPDKVTIVISIKYKIPDCRPPSLIEQSIAFVTECHAELKDKYWFGPLLGLEIYDIPYPNFRPPRDMYPWGTANGVDFISEEYNLESPQGKMDEAIQLITAPFPEGALRFKQNDLNILQWIDDFSSPEEISRKLSERSKWYAENIDLPIQSGYNELGDKLEISYGWEKHSILTFYEPLGQVGYRMTLPYEDNSLSEETVNEITSWIEDGSLPDATPIRTLNLIVPDRQSALAILDRAKAMGVNKVLYPDDNRRFWNPSPPGQWLSN
ncbi:hypothetical protein BJP36_08540 [Moorena producens JHB]|uniref:Uncharacterized protein n=2 Tax=Moorena TaxID=1155738 RepID=A0A1D9FXB6_MOOP1|nr:hypothetical protein [Moorena producens]AOY79963.2 hypothetical protein BJP36_08540 [Moorena producens JHB]